MSELNNQIYKTCSTCLHQIGSGTSARCEKGGFYCSTMRQTAYFPATVCNENFSGWVAIPPRPPQRSLTQWFYDTFLKVNK